MIYANIHAKFKLNETSFKSKNELLAYSKNISSSIFSFLSEWFDDNDFVIVHTSGSTGTPKQIQLKKAFMVNSALATGTYFELPENTNALLCLSTDYIAGKMMLVRALVLGWQLDVVEPNSYPLIGIDKTYDFCAMVPLQLYNSIDRLDYIKKLIVGGGVVSYDLQQKISKLKTEIFATYGMTETITHIAVMRLNNTQVIASVAKQPVNKKEITSKVSHLRNDASKESHYHTLPNIQISKDNRDCLVINAPKISNEKITTNDLVTLISESEFKWLGRYDTIINSGGVKLIPEQIERKLSVIINRRFFVTGTKDSVLGEKLILVVESRKEENDISKAVKNLKSLSKFEIPKKIYFVEKFEETETKKIRRAKTLVKLSLS